MDFVADKMFSYPVGVMNSGKENVKCFLSSRTIKCLSCGFVFCQLRPDSEEMANYYDGYGTSVWIQERAKYEPRYIDMLKRGGPTADTKFHYKFLEIKKFFHSISLPDSGRLLDFGGGAGDAIDTIFNNFIKFSYDIAGLKMVDGCISLNTLENVEPFDIILCQEVLEHVPYPNETLLDICKVLNKNGYLFITVPLEVDDNLDELNSGLIFHEHINKFTSESLSVLVRRNGFIIEKISVVQFEIFGQANISIFCLAKKIY